MREWLAAFGLAILTLALVAAISSALVGFVLLLEKYPVVGLPLLVILITGLLTWLYRAAGKRY